MSDHRKILVAKRKNGRDKFTDSTGNPRYNQENSKFRKGIKRPIPPTPKKNLANERLKRLRTSLNDEVKNVPNHSQEDATNIRISKIRQRISCITKKRPQTGKRKDIAVMKVPKNSVYILKTHVLSKSPSTHSQNQSVSINFNKAGMNQSANALNSSVVANSQPASAGDNDAMEWSSTDNNVQHITSDTIGTSSLSSINYNNSNEFVSNALMKNSLFIVVDTNIFISHMSLIKNIIEMNSAGCKKPVIYIPWIVIEELDFIKDSNRNSPKWKAQEAIKYIESKLSVKNERIMGQTLDEVNEQKDTGKSQDNKIIGCCLQVLDKYQNMILLTDDINLRNKAHINHVPVTSHKEIMSKIMSLSNNTKAQMILEKMTSLCSIVIHECAIKAYGQACYKMQIYQNKPQSLQDCIQIFTKYWFPVFQEILMKQFKKSIDDLSLFLTSHKTIKDDSNEVNELLRLCVRVCIFLKDVDSCKNAIESTIRDLNNVKEF